MSKLGFITLFLIFALNGLKCQDYTILHIEESATFQDRDVIYFLNNFVKPNLQYPDSAYKNNIVGKVVIQFAVDSDGQVVDIIILRSLDPLCDKEAIRVITLSNGMWTPGKVKGKNVKQRFIVPIVFAMSDDIIEMKVD